MKESGEFPEGGVWDVLRSDDLFSDFLKADFDETAAATTNKVTAGLNIAEHLRKLTECISLIDTEIHNQVIAVYLVRDHYGGSDFHFIVRLA